MKTVERYGRIQFRALEGDMQLWIQTPSGIRESIMTFVNQEYEFSYDRHGYEDQIPVGDSYNCARYTPQEEGEYVVFSQDGKELDRFVCEDTGLKGYICVSPDDSRYFAYSDGGSYVPIGLNLCFCDYDRQPAGNEHFAASSVRRTTGLIRWERWFREMKKNGVNYARLWLSSPYAQARTELMGVHDLSAFARVDKIIELARENGVRIKMCLEHFRTFTDPEHFTYKRIIDSDTGKVMTDVESWLTEEKWNERWLEDIKPYIARYQNDPVVFAWELWNEMECVDAPFEAVVSFTEKMLPRIRKLSPRNMVVNSLGSYDEAGKQKLQDAFAGIADMDFLQVHRYMDQGAPLEICWSDPVAFSVDAIRCCSTGKKPVLLAETGAVNDRHVGPFRFYQCDHDGLIFMDVTYPPFFAGAAGSGHIWHWDWYVDTQNLWHQFKPLSEALSGIQVDKEHFEPFTMEHEDYWMLGLRGKTVTMLLVRNRKDRWDYVLRDGKQPKPDSLKVGLNGDSAKAYWLGNDEGQIKQDTEGWLLSDFIHGCILVIQY